MKKRLTAVLALCLVLLLVDCSKEKGTNFNPDEKTTTINTVNRVGETISELYVSAGVPYMPSDSDDGYRTLDSFLSVVEEKGMGITFDREHISAMGTGWLINTVTPLDGWGRSLTFYICTSNEDDWPYNITVVSNGEDGELQCELPATTTEIPDCDDIIYYTEYSAKSYS